MDLFASKFKPKRMLLIGNKGLDVETFLKTPILDFFR